MLSTRPRPRRGACLETDSACLEIELDGQAGVGRGSGRWIVSTGPAGFAQRRLLEAVCGAPWSQEGGSGSRLFWSLWRRLDVGWSARAVMGRILVRRCGGERPAPAGFRGGGQARASRPHRLWVVRGISFWETSADEPGSVRLFHRGRARDRAAASRLADSMGGLEGVERCPCRYGRVGSRSIAVRHWPWPSQVDRVERILEGGKVADPREAALRSGGVPEATDAPVIAGTGWKRLRYGAMAGGALP